MFQENRWEKSQKAEIEFWRKREAAYAHISRVFWEKELSNYQDNIKAEDFEDKKILEIGCGPKGMIHYIPGKEKWGVDPLIQEYKKLNILEDGGVKHIIGIGEKLDFDSETFDIVICFNVLDHSKNPQKVCEEMYRVLKRGGKVIFHSHCITPEVKPFSWLLKYFDKPHPWHFTPTEIKKMFSKVKLKEQFTLINRFHWRARNLIKHLIARVIILNYFAIFEK